MITLASVSNRLPWQNGHMAGLVAVLADCASNIVALSIANGSRVFRRLAGGCPAPHFERPMPPSRSPGQPIRSPWSYCSDGIVLHVELKVCSLVHRVCVTSRDLDDETLTLRPTRRWSRSYISTCTPSSTTRSGGRRKNAVARTAFLAISTNSFSRQIAMPFFRVTMIVSRPRK